MSDTKAFIKGKMVLRGSLELHSPLIIGGGTSEYGETDIVVVKDARGWPYIPGSSLAGVLRSHFRNYAWVGTTSGQEAVDIGKQAEMFWGSAGSGGSAKQRYQSALNCRDAVLEDTCTASVVIRDGVKIDPLTGTAEDKKKYDYEITEPGVRFGLNLECTLRSPANTFSFRSLLAWIALRLEKGDINLGAMSGKGFGRVRLVDWVLEEFLFDRHEDDNSPRRVLAWLDRFASLELCHEPRIWPAARLRELAGAFVSERRDFTVDARFNIKTSLIVRSYPGKPEEPDAVHIKSQGRNVLPGTTVKGALRSRALRIVNTLGGPGPAMCAELFGDSGEDDPKQAVGGRFRCEETPVTIQAIVEEIQKRVRIDRFTGGVMPGALFDSQPLWPSAASGQSPVRIRFSIDNYRDWEAGLALLLLKDLWTGDLPLGGEKNVGRGVLNGVRAVISITGQEDINLAGEPGSPILQSPANRAPVLEEYVRKFNEEISLRAKKGGGALGS